MDPTADSAGTRAARIPVFVLTGFLGAGKTSLLNAVLAAGGAERTAVIVNEFGEIGLDRLFVRMAGDGIVEMSNGCLCCTSRGELAETLMQLVHRDIGRVIIETTGLADPVPVLQAILADADVSRHFELGGVVTLVDSVNAPSTLAEHEEARRQVALADRLVITKADLLAPHIRDERLRELDDLLRRLNGQAPILDRADSAAMASLFDGRIWLRGRAGADALRADAHHHHHTRSDVNRHGDRIAATVIRHDRPIPMRALKAFLELVASAHADKVLRLKGLVAVDGMPGPVIVHGVQGILHEPEPLDEWPDADRTTRIVAIVRDMDPNFVGRLFAGFAGIPMADTPDRQALMENPLAIPGMGKPRGAGR